MKERWGFFPVDEHGRLLIFPERVIETVTEKKKEERNTFDSEFFSKKYKQKRKKKIQPTLAYCCSLRIHMLVESLGHRLMSGSAGMWEGTLGGLSSLRLLVLNALSYT